MSCSRTLLLARFNSSSWHGPPMKWVISTSNVPSSFPNYSCKNATLRYMFDAQRPRLSWLFDISCKSDIVGHMELQNNPEAISGIYELIIRSVWRGVLHFPTAICAVAKQQSCSLIHWNLPSDLKSRSCRDPWRVEIRPFRITSYASAGCTCIIYCGSICISWLQV